MNAIIKLWTNHGTKVLGAVQAVQAIIVGLLGIQGLIPQADVKYWSAAGVVLGILTVRRGYQNSAALPDQRA